MKSYTLFLATKAMITNDMDPFGGKPKFPGTQWNQKGLIAKYMVKMIKLES